MLTERQCIEIYEQYCGRIRRFCAAMLYGQQRDAAEDIAHEVFLEMLEKQDQLAYDDILPWLYKTAKHAVTRYLRAHKSDALTDALSDHEAALLYEETFYEGDAIGIDCLTQEEIDLLLTYCDAGKGEKGKVAAQYHLSLSQLYNKIRQIRKKAIGALTKEKNGKSPPHEHNDDFSPK